MLTSLTKAACMEGISLTYEWSMKPFIVEIDSQVAANMIKQLEIDQFPTASITCEIKSLLARGRHFFCRSCAPCL